MSIPCQEAVLERPRISILKFRTDLTIDLGEDEICYMELYDPRKNQTQSAHGLNWGMGSKAHTRLNDANIPIRKKHLIDFPLLFPPKQELSSFQNKEGRVQRQNDPIEIIWDDGTVMKGLLEGSQDLEGVKYPKQISSFPEKDILGKYIRKRLNVKLDERVDISDLEKYGRKEIAVSILGDGVYYFDFSVKKTVD